MYPATSLFVAVGQLAIAVLVLFSYPLQVHPCRNCLDKVFHFGSATDKHEDCDDTVEDEHGPGEMTPLKHTVLTFAIVAGGFTVAYFVDNLEMGGHSSSLPCVSPRANGKQSLVLCRSHRVDDYFVHPSWTVLLEGK
jgi:hypothetical protein